MTEKKGMILIIFFVRTVNPIQN